MSNVDNTISYFSSKMGFSSERIKEDADSIYGSMMEMVMFTKIRAYHLLIEYIEANDIIIKNDEINELIKAIDDDMSDMRKFHTILEKYGDN